MRVRVGEGKYKVYDVLEGKEVKYRGGGGEVVFTLDRVEDYKLIVLESVR